MVKLVLVTGAALLFGVLLGLDHVRSRFEHSRRSLRVLAIQAVVGYVMVLLIALRALDWAAHWVALLALPLALPVFVLLAVITVEYWRLSRQQEFDSEIGRIERQQIGILERRDELQRDLADLKRQQSRRSLKSDSGLFRKRQLQRQVETWTQEGGFARIRSLRVEDWTKEMAAQSPTGLRARMDELDALAASARDAGDQEKLEQVQVQLAVAEIHLLESGNLKSEGEPSDLERRVLDLNQELERCQAQLGELESELEEWRRRKSFFQSQKLRLD